MSRRRERRDKPHAQFVELCVGDIVMDERWHGRDAAGSARPIDAAEQPGQEWSDEQLETDIRKRGLIEPLRVRKLEDGRWGLIAGSRRWGACMRISARMLVPCTYDERERDDFIAASTTLAENTHRRAMRNWEIANHLWSMHAARPELEVWELADACTFDREFCKQLVDVKSRACPELWTLFERHDGQLPAGISWPSFVAVCRLVKDDQMEAWGALVDKHVASAKASKRAKRGRYRPSKAKLTAWAAQIEDATDDYVRGIRKGLLVGAGTEPFKVD